MSEAGDVEDEDVYDDEFEKEEEEEEEEGDSTASPARELSMDLEEFMAMQSPNAAAYPSEDAELPPELRPLEGVSPLPHSKPDNLPTEMSTTEEGSSDFSGKVVSEKEEGELSAGKKPSDRIGMTHARSRSSKDGSISEADIKLLDAQIASLQSSIIKDQLRSNSEKKGEKGLSGRKSRDGDVVDLPDPKAAAISGRRFLEKQSSTKRNAVSESAEIRRLTAEIQERDVLLDRLSKNSLKLAQDCDNLRVEVMRLRRALKEERDRFASMLKANAKELPAYSAPRGNRETALLEAVS